MIRTHLLNYEVEIDEVVTRAWYAQSGDWDCPCDACLHFMALARRRALPAFVLETLDKLGIPAEKATSVCSLTFDDQPDREYELHYRVAGTILRQPSAPLRFSSGRDIGFCNEYPMCPEFDFPAPYFDLQFYVTLP